VSIGGAFPMDLSLLFVIMFIFLLGIGSQWVAWRFSLPAIVLMTIAGLAIGPFVGWMNQEESFGELDDPLIAVAVAIIVFEGSLNLRFKELSGSGIPVWRVAASGAISAWILGSSTAQDIAGPSWGVGFVMAGLFIVTGPTVIMALRRQSKLRPRPTKIL